MGFLSNKGNKLLNTAGYDLSAVSDLWASQPPVGAPGNTTAVPVQ